MRSIRTLLAAIALGTLALSSAANADTFRNGQSFYGTPATQPSAARVVDLATARHLNVAYGETVTFRNEGKEFSWTFNGLDRRGVPMAKIAPAGFTNKPFSVNVAQNPMTRH
ncbi:CzcE family metal-binding protein [Sphaerotilaceae bacterium SBD11-9]